ncbi:MAG: glycosyltransferase family 39 protein [Chloroflexi bacterium]|nr:glycosyltransferase family 39 protein [Chloroflexota bacterium]
MSDAIHQRVTPPVAAPSEPHAGRAVSTVRRRVVRSAVARLFGAWPEIALGVLACVLYLPIVSRVLILGPDAVEYLDIARRLAAGQGFLLGVKAFHFGGTDVLHHGLAERPPLFPILVALLLKLGFESVAAQVLNAVLSGLSVTLVALIGRQLFGREVGVLAALLTIVTPLVTERMLWPMTEALAIGLSLLATYLMMQRVERPSVRTSGLAGVVLGLAYLTRPTVLSLVGALAVTAMMLAARRRDVIRPLLAYAAGVGLSFVPISAYSIVTRGSLFYSGQTYLYALYKDPEVMEFGFQKPLPTAAQFISENSALVLRTIGETFSSYAYLLFAEWELMLPLALGWPMVVWALARREYPRAAVVPLVVAVTNFAFYGLTWSTFQDRYLLLTMLLLFPFVVDGLRRLRLDRLPLPTPGRATARPGPRLGLTHLIVVGALVLWTPHLIRQYRGEFRYGELPVGTRKDEGLVWTAPPRWVRDGDLMRVVNWVNTRTEPLAVLAHAQPWPFTYFTGRPATLLPVNLGPDRLRELLVSYQVDYVLLDGRDRERRRYLDMLEDLEPAGVTDVSLGAYRIFDVRALRRQP